MPSSRISQAQFCIAVVLIVLSRVSAQQPPAVGLRAGFYSDSCSNAESIVQSVVGEFFAKSNNVSAGLLRLFFHDCFVRGCDASILLDAADTRAGDGGITVDTEKSSRAARTLRGFDVIEAAKAELEKSCKGVVSCADILALAVRDAVVLAGGPKYDMPTGRKDGRLSFTNEGGSIPGPQLTANESIEAFMRVGLLPQDLVVLLGAHTIGVTHCNFVRGRLFNFQGTGSPDPSLDPGFLKILQDNCTTSTTTDDLTFPLDQSTPSAFDNEYYNQLMAGKGLLTVDQQMRAEPATDAIVRALANGTLDFKTAFGQSLIKMGSIGPPDFSKTEIRNVCNRVN